MTPIEHLIVGGLVIFGVVILIYIALKVSKIRSYDV